MASPRILTTGGVNNPEGTPGRLTDVGRADLATAGMIRRQRFSEGQRQAAAQQRVMEGLRAERIQAELARVQAEAMRKATQAQAAQAAADRDARLQLAQLGADQALELELLRGDRASSEAAADRDLRRELVELGRSPIEQLQRQILEDRMGGRNASPNDAAVMGRLTSEDRDIFGLAPGEEQRNAAAARQRLDQAVALGQRMSPAQFDAVSAGMNPEARMAYEQALVASPSELVLTGDGARFVQDALRRTTELRGQIGAGIFSGLDEDQATDRIGAILNETVQSIAELTGLSEDQVFPIVRDRIVEVIGTEDPGFGFSAPAAVAERVRGIAGPRPRPVARRAPGGFAPGSDAQQIGGL